MVNADGEKQADVLLRNGLVEHIATGIALGACPFFSLSSQRSLFPPSSPLGRTLWNEQPRLLLRHIATGVAPGFELTLPPPVPLWRVACVLRGERPPPVPPSGRPLGMTSPRVPPPLAWLA